MVTCLKNVLIVDGSGWIPFLGDIVIEDDKVSIVSSLYQIADTFDKTEDYKWNAYCISGFDAPMTKEKYEAELATLKADVESGTRIHKAVRKLTGYGVGQREYLKAGVPADVFVVDKDLTTVLAAYADGKAL